MADKKSISTVDGVADRKSRHHSIHTCIHYLFTILSIFLTSVISRPDHNSQVTCRNFFLHLRSKTCSIFRLAATFPFTGGQISITEWKRLHVDIHKKARVHSWATHRAIWTVVNVSSDFRFDLDRHVPAKSEEKLFLKLLENVFTHVIVPPKGQLQLFLAHFGTFLYRSI